MPAGRPRKQIAASTGKISKEQRKLRESQEKRLKLSNDALIPPPWLSDDGREEFERVVKECENVGALDNLNLSILAIYAQAWEMYCLCSNAIQKNGTLETRTNAYGDYQVVSPILQVQEKYTKIIMQCSSKLGLAVTDRLKLVVPEAKEQAPINKFMAFTK